MLKARRSSAQGEQNEPANDDEGSGDDGDDGDDEGNDSDDEGNAMSRDGEGNHDSEDSGKCLGIGGLCFSNLIEPIYSLYMGFGLCVPCW